MASQSIPFNSGTPDTSGSHPVHIVAGTGPNAGRVEIFSGGEWGAVSDEGWDVNDANVVCRQLGFGEALEILRHLPADNPQVSYTTDKLLACSQSRSSHWMMGRLRLQDSFYSVLPSCRNAGA